MSKRLYLGTEIDRVYLHKEGRLTTWRVGIWNPNRTTINDVVLGYPRSPEYDITDWVISIEYWENVVFEDNDNAVATNCTIDLIYETTARPIPISEKTLLDGTPIRIYQGDKRIPQTEWMVIFTGVIRGYPSVAEFWREKPDRPAQIQITAVGRAEAYLNKLVTARSYASGLDVGKAAVETAIEWMELDRREINIGYQAYAIGHTQAQLVDIEVLKGIAQILFTVGKKPRFDYLGFLTAADTDLNKPPVRTYSTKDFVVSIVREQRMSSGYNSVRLLGVDDELTEVVERNKRLAHGTLTSGFFQTEVNQTVWFSETPGKQSGGRRAKDTYLKSHISTLGVIFANNVGWYPFIEEDGYTVFGGEIRFDTGYNVAIRATIMGSWAAATAARLHAQIGADEAAAANDEEEVQLFVLLQEIFGAIEKVTMVGILLSMTEIGTVEWEIFGKPFQNTFQELCATAQLDGVLTADLREKEIKNDWLYDIEYMRGRAKDLLDRELVKAQAYKIVMLDDPVIEVDDVIEIDRRRYYVTSIRKTIRRTGAPIGTMTLTAWRIT